MGEGPRYFCPPWWEGECWSGLSQKGKVPWSSKTISLGREPPSHHPSPPHSSPGHSPDQRIHSFHQILKVQDTQSSVNADALFDRPLCPRQSPVTLFLTPSSSQELCRAAATAPTGQSSQRPEQGLLQGGLRSESSPKMGHFGWAKAGRTLNLEPRECEWSKSGMTGESVSLSYL